MALEVPIQLDGTDVRIIEMLQEDRRTVYKDIAQKAGVSLPTVRSRIQRLVELGVIKKFAVIVDADRILGKVRGVLLPQVSPSNVDEVMAKLATRK
ncbi:MAG: winged helix-turn-helix transcriptional regulator [Nitrososphaerota archaeon]|nr:winged helix-turn-helix transcriptional regulator [Nitrososphaerota archaeon]